MIVLNGTTGLSGVDGSAGTPALQGSDNNTGISFGTDTVTINTVGVARVTTDASGNLGLGVTPSAWGTNYKAIQLNATTVPYVTSNNQFLGVGANYYRDGSGNHIYVTSSVASNYVQDAGVHKFFTAPSGTAGNTISFTQAMTLDASGNLGVGTASPTANLHVRNTGGNATLKLEYGTGGTTSQIIGANNELSLQVPGASAISMYTNGSERARINSSGNLLVGIATDSGGSRLRVRSAGNTVATNCAVFENSSATNVGYIRDDGAWNSGAGAGSPYNLTTGSAANLFVASDGFLYRSTSSLKYKTDVQDSTRGLADVMNLRPVTYKGKNDGDTVFGGLIAEEVHEAGLTEFVQYAEDGSPDALAYGNMVSLLVKAIQEQQSIITQLQADVAALKGAA